MPATLLLCDDHNLVREGPAALMRQRMDWTVVAETADGRQAVELAARLKPDVALLDVAPPDCPVSRRRPSARRRCGRGSSPCPCTGTPCTGAAYPRRPGHGPGEALASGE